MPGQNPHIGEHSAKLQNDLTPEMKDKHGGAWRGGELMSEEQARRLREVSKKKNLKKYGDKWLP